MEAASDGTVFADPDLLDVKKSIRRIRAVPGGELLERSKLELVKTKRRGEGILFENVLFSERKTNKTSTRYACRHKGCRAALKKYEGEVYSNNKEHSHDIPKKNISARKKFIELLRVHTKGKIIVRSGQTYRQVLKKVRDGEVPGLDAKDVPKFSSFKSIMERVKRENYPPLPKTLAEVPHTVAEFPEQFAVTSKRQDGTGEKRFLLDVLTSGKEGMSQIFASDEDLSLLSKADILFVDGTFRTVPPYMTQLWTIHGYFEGSTPELSMIRPLVYVLMTRKNQASYAAVLERIKKHMEEELRILWDPMYVSMDFEEAEAGAFREVFPETKIAGCFFHYRQCIQKWLQSNRLLKLYKSNMEVRIHVEKMAALCYLPVESVEDGFSMVMETSPSELDAKVSDFNDYMYEQWVSKNVETWNIFDRPDVCMTNNACETWHKNMNSFLASRNPNLWVIVELLRDDQAFNTDRFARFNTEGGERRRVRPAQKKAAARAATSQYMNEEISMGEYLMTMGRTVLHHINFTEAKAVKKTNNKRLRVQ